MHTPRWLQRMYGRGGGWRASCCSSRLLSGSATSGAVLLIGKQAEGWFLDPDQSDAALRRQCDAPRSAPRRYGAPPGRLATRRDDDQSHLPPQPHHRRDHRAVRQAGSQRRRPRLQPGRHAPLLREGQGPQDRRRLARRGRQGDLRGRHRHRREDMARRSLRQPGRGDALCRPLRHESDGHHRSRREEGARDAADRQFALRRVRLAGWQGGLHEQLGRPAAAGRRRHRPALPGQDRPENGRVRRRVALRLRCRLRHDAPGDRRGVAPDRDGLQQGVVAALRRELERRHDLRPRPERRRGQPGDRAYLHPPRRAALRLDAERPRPQPGGHDALCRQWRQQRHRRRRARRPRPDARHLQRRVRRCATDEHGDGLHPDRVVSHRRGGHEQRHETRHRQQQGRGLARHAAADYPERRQERPQCHRQRDDCRCAERGATGDVHRAVRREQPLRRLAGGFAPAAAPGCRARAGARAHRRALRLRACPLHHQGEPHLRSGLRRYGQGEQRAETGAVPPPRLAQSPRPRRPLRPAGQLLRQFA